VFDSVTTLKQIKCLDLSKNKFWGSTLNHLLGRLPAMTQLHTLSLSSVNLSDENCNELSQMIRAIPKLKILNISGNQNLGPDSLRKMLLALKNST